jgi:hypothetical protein
MRIRGKAATWRCGHLYPVVVEPIEGGKRARCLGCGEGGPVRADARSALRALKFEVMHREKVGS